MKLKLIILFLFGWTIACAQSSVIYNSLPVGKYAVGFKIITIEDPSRVSKPEYDYLGEKTTGDRIKKITIHIWYPAKPNTGVKTITYGDYCYNDLLETTEGVISDERKNAQVKGKRNSTEGWFGKVSDDSWETLVQTPMLGQINATPVPEKFPLLIGELRPLSTSVTNELLASNGYVVAMIAPNNIFASFPVSGLTDIPDMQFAINYLQNNTGIDEHKIGTFGFSGSGFSQVLFAMYDYRIKALADIESGVYMNGLFQAFSVSNYYDPSKLRVPFLHIFSRDLSKEEKYIDEFGNKTKFAKRYRLLINQPHLHHWDSAAEGYTSCVILKSRGAEQDNIKKSFEIESNYLLNFFNAELKSDASSQKFLTVKPDLGQIQPGLWDMKILEPGTRAPDKDEFEDIIRKKGISTAISTFNATFKNDTSTNLKLGFIVNRLGSQFLNEKKYDEAIGVFKLNIQLHSDDPNFYDSLAEAYEDSGDQINMKATSAQVLDILNKKSTLTDFEKGLKASAERRISSIK
jgi:hypothetical protein